MIDLEDLLLSAETLDEITPSIKGLPTTDGMLVWHALAFAEGWLKNYLLDAPDCELVNLNQIQQHIQNAQSSTRLALSLYPEIFKCVEIWLKQLDPTDVNLNKSLTLLKSVDYLLKALPFDCKKISWPMSNWIPATLYTEVNRLQTLSKIKFNKLQQAKQQVLQQVITNNNSSFEQLKLLLDDGLMNLNNKTLAIAENKEPHLFLLAKFTQLQQCLTKNQPHNLNDFWQQYSEPAEFEQLLDILLLDQDEKKSWTRTYQHMRIDKTKSSSIFSTINSSLGAFYNFTSYGVLGVNLTPQIIQNK